MASIIPASQYRAPNVRIITYRDVDSVAVEETQLNYIKNIFRQYRGQTIEIGKRYTSLSAVEYITDNQITEVPVNGFNSWWRIFSQFLFPDSEEWIFGESYNPAGSISDQAQLTIMSAGRVGQSNYEQFFLDGTSHCVFTPIMNWAIDLSINAGSPSTKRKYNAKANKIQRLMTEYKEGVPEKDIPSICNELQIGIEIDLPSSLLDKNTEYIKYRSQKKPVKTFKFINTRLNHIELNEITNKDNYEEVSRQELIDIYDNETSFKLWKGDRESGLYQINTLNQIYKLTEEEGYAKEVNEFSDLNNLDIFKVEHNSQRALSKYLLNNVNRLQSLILNCKYPKFSEEGDIFKEFLENEEKMLEEEQHYRKCNSCQEYRETFVRGYEYNLKALEVIDYIHSLKNLNHIDLSKAFTRGSECNFYQGYLGKITDFRRCNKIMGLGIYTIYNIKNIPPLLKKLGVVHENNAYPSPELDYYESLGITFDIWGGCWGSKTDITFTEGMFNEEGGTKHYCKWYGCLMKLTKKERYNFDCDKIEFAKLNNISEKADIRYNQYKGTGIIEYKKDKCKHSSHIASFIHSYARITMLEQLLKFKDTSQIIAVQVDGIFYKGDVEIDKQFVKKVSKGIKHIALTEGGQYVIDCENDKPKLPKGRKHNPVELHVGPGGAGKTHNNLIDKGLIAPLYVAPSWKLARGKGDEYNIDCSVFHYLTTKDPEVWLPNLRNYNTLIIDEISMLSEQDKLLILKRFSHHKIIFCGDLGYQLPPVEGYEFIAKDFPVMKHTKNYRCQCTILAKVLDKCRKLIEEDFIDIDCREFLTTCGFVIHQKELIDYSVEDLIITKTHKNKDFYSQRYKDMEKYLVKENTRDYSNGEIVIGKKPLGVESLLQHAFTIHSIQGETCKDTLFIDINKINCLRMLYTALSRAKLLSQIKIIE
tara:strand:+ start:1176 stop:3959 length:2784 start_codon:yes stop_codon:yes gene_type:complete